MANTTEYHVTAVRSLGVYGHETKYCNESGCSGSEKYLGRADTMRSSDFGAIAKGDVVELDDKGDDKIVTCAYCDAEGIEAVDPKTLDDAGWATEATKHLKDCEWVATRAHTR